MKKKLLLTALVCAAASLLYWFSGKDLPYLDHSADRYFIETTSEAALAYASVRGVNAIVSVLQESEVAVSPAGIGINIAAGQILDPINDMAERLSSVLVTALVSLGLQKLVFEISRAIPLKCAAVLILFMCIPIWYARPAQLTHLWSLIGRLCALFIVLRLVLPLSSLLNDSLYRHLLKDEIRVAKDQLTVLSSEREKLNLLDSAGSGGIISSFTSSAKKKIDHAKELFQNVADNADTIIATLLKLTTLYVSLFILQVIAIPMAMLWCMIIFVNSLLKTLFTRLPGPPRRTPAHGPKEIPQIRDT